MYSRLGADPETFLQDQAGNPVSAIGLIQADKWNPFQIPGMEKGFTLQEDNVSMEFGIPPAASAEEFIHHIKAVMAKGLEKAPNLSFSKLSCIIFPEKEMQHPAAHIFGCEPDFDAWSGSINHKPEPPHPLMRSAGGHIHVETKRNAREAVKLMDLYLSVPAAKMDSGLLRKTMYGKRGAYRPKPYGFEYRPLSNFWIFSDRLIQWAFDNTQRAIVSDVDVDVEDEAIRMAVNEGNLEAAEYLIEKYQLEVV